MPGSHVYGLVILLFLTSLQAVNAWGNEELELFDLVEEVNQNFYEVLGVEQTVAVADIKRAYRRLSVKYHPDKNKEEGAEEKFRQIVSIYEVLKDGERRQQYDNILIYGLPDWRQPVYYYRQVRKLGLVELLVALFLIITVGHIIVKWTIYLERKFEMQEVFESRKKKEKKGKKKLERERQENEKLEAFQEELDALPSPKLKDLVPVQVVRGIWWIIVSTPSWLLALKEHLTKKEQIEENEDEDEETEKTKRKRQRVEVPDLDFKPKMVETVAPVVYTEQNQITDELKRESEKVVDRKPDKSGKEWTDEEISLLAKAVSRFPAGVGSRWEKIAEYTGRTVAEVTKMSKQLKTSYSMSVDPSAQGITGQAVSSVQMKKGLHPSDNIISERDDFGNPSLDDVKMAKRKNKVSSKQPVQAEKGGKPTTIGASTEVKLVVDKTKVDSDSLVWSQNQQKILEWTLTQYPKGTAERWEKIAEHIPGKSKEDCIARFKYLADIVKKRKAATNTDSSATAS